MTDNGLQSLLTLRRSRETSDSKSLLLKISGGLHARTDGIRRFTQAIATQLFIVHARDFDVNINTVEQQA
ncbi:MAG: hypothetical protein ABI621_04415 [Chloroflexota bacterium]